MEPRDEEFMRQALIEAEAAREDGEVPVGAIVVRGDTIIGRGRNCVIRASDPTAHAEILALRNAAQTTGNYRLIGAVLYSTIEPCAMCAGALVHARIERLAYGAKDLKAGAVDTHFGICSTDFLNHQISVEGGILEDECRRMLQSFFRERRNSQQHAERCESG
ncbi:MAG: tRNA adenosine(34) deaminase TadA [Blastocatellia bacterium]